MSLGRILGALFGTASGKGYIGESKVSVAAMFGLPRSTYTSFRDVTLPVPDGTTQVDHIFVSRFGVFVVETKNMGGWIFGGERDRQWTQVFRNGQKARFQNPLRQNYRPGRGPCGNEGRHALRLRLLGPVLTNYT